VWQKGGGSKHENRQNNKEVRRKIPLSHGGMVENDMGERIEGVPPSHQGWQSTQKLDRNRPTPPKKVVGG
jgi:hypothetical protein